MFYSEEQAISACSDEPSLVFELIKEGETELVDELLSKKIVSVNTKDEKGNDVLTRLLRHGDYDIVLKYISNTEWNINNQNVDGNTFMHYLAKINYLEVMNIIKKLEHNRKLDLNPINNSGMTALDISIESGNIYTTMKILENKKFTTIGVLSFKNLYDAFIKSKSYGKYSKITNIEIIIDNLESKKSLTGDIKELISYLSKNIESLKEAIFEDKTSYLDNIINTLIIEGSN